MYIRQLGGYAESRLYELGPLDTGFVVALRLGNDIPSGIVIARWDFVLPWECRIDWDYHPSYVIPKQDQPAYEKLLKSRLSEKLNERRLLARGRPVEGLLCGRMFEPIPEPFARVATVSAEFSVTDTTGYTKSLPVSLWVCRSAAPALKARTTKRKGRLFDKRDKPQLADYLNDRELRPVPGTDAAMQWEKKQRAAFERAMRDYRAWEELRAKDKRDRKDDSTRPDTVDESLAEAVEAK